MSKDLITRLVGKSLLKKDVDNNIVGTTVVTKATNVENLAGVVLTLDGNESSVYFLDYTKAIELSKE